MSEGNAFPVGGALVAALLMLPVLPAHGFSAKPKDAQGAEVVGHLLGTDFTKECDSNTYPLRKNLSYLFDNKYMGVDFESWEVNAKGTDSYGVVLHYIDGEAGPVTAKWRVDLAAQEARLKDKNAKVLSCLTGYL